ncbi:MAG: hypothetical protein ABI232_07035, partial [Jatrophihabitantaceae bacterium]
PQLAGRCGPRLLRVSAAKDTFYSAVAAGHSPTEQNIVQRSRVPSRVDAELRKAYSVLGVPICDLQSPPSTLIGPYQRPPG